jgi:Domain of unknown function (DUF1929)
MVVTSSTALKIISIIRLGSSTHSVNNDQRRLELCGPAAGACAAGTSNTVTIPADPGIALPGALLRAVVPVSCFWLALPVLPRGWVCAARMLCDCIRAR